MLPPPSFFRRAACATFLAIAQHVEQLARALRACCWIEGNHPPQGFSQTARHFGGAQLFERQFSLAFVDAFQRVAHEGHFAAEQIPEGHPQAVNVAARVNALLASGSSVELLRAGESRRAHEPAARVVGSEQRVGRDVDRLGQAPVDDLDVQRR